MTKKITRKLCGIFLCFLFIFSLCNINFDLIFSLNDNDPITISNLKTINSNHNFGKFIDSELNESTITTGNNLTKTTTMTVKLFGFIPIKKINVTICPDKTVYLGGIPLGFSISTKGVVVVGQNSIYTNSGNRNSTKSIEIKNGDILTKVNGVSILNAKDIKEILKKHNEKEYIELTLLRDNKELNCKIKPVYDNRLKEFKLGLWIKNDAQGIGTLTFVTKDNKYGALGHPICDFETGAVLPVNSGKVYNCSTLGIIKGEKGKAGELRCLFVEREESQGTIKKNTSCGVFGEITDKDNVIDKNIYAKLGTRMSAKTGKAKIISSISGIREEYDIEIIKTYHQPSSHDKSFVFRVKDKRLLALTGGIVQGMSGSPITQNGHLIGAVTHVFLYDPTKGYGVYSDWMLNELNK